MPTSVIVALTVAILLSAVTELDNAQVDPPSASTEAATDLKVDTASISGHVATLLQIVPEALPNPGINRRPIDSIRDQYMEAFERECQVILGLGSALGTITTDQLARTIQFLSPMSLLFEDPVYVGICAQEYAHAIFEHARLLQRRTSEDEEIVTSLKTDIESIYAEVESALVSTLTPTIDKETVLLTVRSHAESMKNRTENPLARTLKRPLGQGAKNEVIALMRARLSDSQAGIVAHIEALAIDCEEKTRGESACAELRANKEAALIEILRTVEESIYQATVDVTTVLTDRLLEDTKLLELQRERIQLEESLWLERQSLLETEARRALEAPFEGAQVFSSPSE